MTTPTVSSVTRQRLAGQGFMGMSDEELAELGPWLRLAPAMTFAWVVLATASASAWSLWAMAAIQALVAELGRHPVDWVYNLGVRRLLGRSRGIPRSGAPTRFTCGLSFVWLFAAGGAFHAGLDLLGCVLGLALAAPIAATALTDRCLGCWIFARLRRAYARQETAQGQPTAS
jgi:hypothetical protein